MNVLIAFTLKIIDNWLGTSKTIYIAKGKYHKGAVMNGISTFFYLIAIVQIAKSQDIKSIIAMCFATYLGTLLSAVSIKKSERDKLYIYKITASNLDEGTEFLIKVKKEDLAIKANVTYDIDFNKTLSFSIYCSTKEESKLVESIIPKDFKYHIYSPIEN